MKGNIAVRVKSDKRVRTLALNSVSCQRKLFYKLSNCDKSGVYAEKMFFNGFVLYFGWLVCKLSGRQSFNPSSSHT